MPNNWCRNIVLLYKQDIFTGCKEVIGVFTSFKAAKKFRRDNFAKEVAKSGLNFSDMYPIERRLVTIQSEV